MLETFLYVSRLNLTLRLNTQIDNSLFGKWSVMCKEAIHGKYVHNTCNFLRITHPWNKKSATMLGDCIQSAYLWLKSKIM